MLAATKKPARQAFPAGRRPRLKILLLKVDGRGFAEPSEIVGQPGVGPFAPDLVQMAEKIPGIVQTARPRKFTNDVFGFDDVDKHFLAFGHFALAEALVDEGNGAHLADERRIKTDLLHPVHDVM